MWWLWTLSKRQAFYLKIPERGFELVPCKQKTEKVDCEKEAQESLKAPSFPNPLMKVFSKKPRRKPPIKGIVLIKFPSIRNTAIIIAKMKILSG
jgi:hypothetical protein